MPVPLQIETLAQKEMQSLPRLGFMGQPFELRNAALCAANRGGIVPCCR